MTAIVLSRGVLQSDLDVPRAGTLTWEQYIYAICRVLFKKKKHIQFPLYDNLVCTYFWKKDAAILRWKTFEPHVLIIPAYWRDRKNGGYYAHNSTVIPSEDFEAAAGARTNIMPWCNEIDLDAVNVHNYGVGLLAESNLAFQVINHPNRYCVPNFVTIRDITIKDFAFYERVYNLLVSLDSTNHQFAWAMLKQLSFTHVAFWDDVDTGHPGTPFYVLNENLTLSLLFLAATIGGYGRVGQSVRDERADFTIRHGMKLGDRFGGADGTGPIESISYTRAGLKHLMFDGLHNTLPSATTLFQTIVTFIYDEEGELLKFVDGVDDPNTWFNCTFIVADTTWNGQYDDFFQSTVRGHFPDRITGEVPEDQGWKWPPESIEDRGALESSLNGDDYQFEILKKQSINIGTDAVPEYVDQWSGRLHVDVDGIVIFDTAEVDWEYWKVTPKRGQRLTYYRNDGASNESQWTAFRRLPGYDGIVTMLAEVSGEPIYTNENQNALNPSYSDPVAQHVAQPEVMLFGRTEGEETYQRYVAPVKIRFQDAAYIDNDDNSENRPQWIYQNRGQETVIILQEDDINGIFTASSMVSTAFRNYDITYSYVDTSDEEEPPNWVLIDRFHSGVTGLSWTHTIPEPFLSNLPQDFDTFHSTANNDKRGLVSDIQKFMIQYQNMFDEDTFQTLQFNVFAGDFTVQSIQALAPDVIDETRIIPTWDILFGECGFAKYPDIIDARFRAHSSSADTKSYVDDPAGVDRWNYGATSPLLGCSEHLAAIKTIADSAVMNQSVSLNSLTMLPRLFFEPNPESNDEKMTIYFLDPADNTIISRDEFHIPDNNIRDELSDYQRIIGSVVAICHKYKDEGTPTAAEELILIQARDARENFYASQDAEEDALTDGNRVSLALLSYLLLDNERSRDVYIYLDNLPEFYAPPEEP
jgi:hypothetical protein